MMSIVRRMVCKEVVTIKDDYWAVSNILLFHGLYVN